MTLREKIAIGALILIGLIWGGVIAFRKDLNDFLFYYWLSRNPQIFSAEVALEQQLRELKPIRNKEIADLQITAKSAISVLIKENGEQRVLFEKDGDKSLPLASLTKLMTAWVVLEHYDLSKKITISKLAANQYGEIGKLEERKTFPVEYLLYPLLMESSNGAAFALANDYEGMTERNFVALMNLEAEKMGLKNTFFDNPTGLDPEESKTKMNYSTANDLALFAKKLLEKPLIWEILSLPNYSLYGPELVNTNKFLLNGEGDWQDKIIGGKTGYTGEAGGCLFLVVRAPKAQGFLANVVLGANGKENRFDEMRKLLEWLKIAYKW